MAMLFYLLTLPLSGAAKVYLDIDAPTIQKFPIAIADFNNLAKNGRPGKAVAVVFQSTCANAQLDELLYHSSAKPPIWSHRDRADYRRAPSVSLTGAVSGLNYWLRARFSMMGSNSPASSCCLMLLREN